MKTVLVATFRNVDRFEIKKTIICFLLLFQVHYILGMDKKSIKSGFRTQTNCNNCLQLFTLKMTKSETF